MDSDDSGEGDLRGVIDKLEHLKELGVTGVFSFLRKRAIYFANFWNKKNYDSKVRTRVNFV